MEDTIIISALKEERESLDSSDKKKPIDKVLQEMEEIKDLIIEIKEIIRKKENEKGWWG